MNHYQLLMWRERAIGPFITQSMERAAVRKSVCWICGVTEEGGVLYGKAFAAMRVFSHQPPPLPMEERA
jgi:hypothetical protein